MQVLEKHQEFKLGDHIGAAAFYGCGSLRGVKLHAFSCMRSPRLTRRSGIGIGAFRGCVALKWIAVP